MTHIYLSMTYRKDEIDAVRATGHKHLLLSYALNGHKPIKEMVERLGYKPSVIVDPGSITFSRSNVRMGVLDIMDCFLDDCYSEKETARILLDEVSWLDEMVCGDTTFHHFIKWVLENVEYIDHVMAFDMINKPFHSRYMYRVMKYMGLKPSPVFHYKNDFRYLDEYVADGNALITLGGTIFEKEINKRIEWVAECIERHPNQAFHFLGTQRKAVLDRLPHLYSLDGNHWKITPAQKKNRKPGQSKVEAMIEIIKELQMYDLEGILEKGVL